VNRKVRRGIQGRVGLLMELSQRRLTSRSGPLVWVHSASMGEFEQAKIIIMGLRQRFRELSVLVSFFSPSGYEHSRDYPLADHVTYIPFDSRADARRFVELTKPDLAVFIRYDLWPNHVWELAERKIPILLVNATIDRLTVRRLPFIRSFHRSLYNPLSEILTVSGSDADVFRQLSLDHPRIEVVGDTRFDQVNLRSADALRHPVLPEHIRKGKKVLVAGSCWSDDDAVLLPAFLRLLADSPDILLVHVPHEPTADHVAKLEQDLHGRVSVCRYSAIAAYREEQVIIVDSVGKLLAFYAAADVAFIGGSFGQGVHNVLEAAVFGLPVVFGPRHWNSQEPLQLVELGGGFVVTDEEEAFRTIGNLLQDPVARDRAGERSAAYVQQHRGITERILDHLDPYLVGQPRSAEVSA